MSKDGDKIDEISTSPCKFNLFHIIMNVSLEMSAKTQSHMNTLNAVSQIHLIH